MEARGPVENVISTRGGVLEIAIVALVLSFGINIISNYVYSLIGGRSIIIWLIFSACFIVCFLFIVAKVSSSYDKRIKISGVQFIKSADRRVVSVDGYDFSEKAAEQMGALFSEHKAIGRAWCESGLTVEFSRRDGKISRSIPAANKIQKEQVEYYVLNELSTHLTDYFNLSEVARDKIVEIGREDIPTVLMSNRFLDAFTRPMEDREGFYREENGDDGHRPSGIVVRAYGANGEMFDRFDLSLPKGAKVSRVGESIFVETDRFSMKITAEFEGFTAVPPHEFDELYIGFPYSEIDEYLVEVNVDVKFKLASIFKPSGWVYYKWVDSFIEHLEENMSFDRFLVRIQWDAAATVKRVFDNAPLAKRSISKPAVPDKT